MIRRRTTPRPPPSSRWLEVVDEKDKVKSGIEVTGIGQDEIEVLTRKLEKRWPACFVRERSE